MKINRSLIMWALPVALALVASSAQAEPTETPTPAANGGFKIESPTMARSIKDWHPEQSGRTAASPATTTTPSVEPTAQPDEEMSDSPATPGPPPLEPGKRSERAQEIPLKSIPQ